MHEDHAVDTLDGPTAAVGAGQVADDDPDVGEGQPHGPARPKSEFETEIHCPAGFVNTNGRIVTHPGWAKGDLNPRTHASYL